MSISYCTILAPLDVTDTERYEEHTANLTASLQLMQQEADAECEAKHASFAELFDAELALLLSED